GCSPPSTSLSRRSGKRIKKTRKYDIITTPAERVEMAPLNEEDDEDEDSTVFDVKQLRGALVPARRHSAVEGPAEPITVKGEAFISAVLQPHLLERSELWDDTVGIRLLHLERSGLGDRRHPGIPGQR
ncbi:hypothetical protein DV515_00006439, partial [Chloebia gouldiae]